MARLKEHAPQKLVLPKPTPRVKLSKPREISQDKKATKILVELNDNTILEAEGDHAEKIWAWWMLAESVACDDGYQYTGKPIVPKQK